MTPKNSSISRRNNAKIILSCPHAQCNLSEDDYAEHWCDWIAEDALNGVLKYIDDDNVEHIIGRDQRQEYDLNRHRSRAQPFRFLLRNKIQAGDTHVDIHSYPVTDKSDDWYKFDTVVFEHGDGTLTKSIKEHLSAAGYTCKVAKGDHINDVCCEATDIGANSCLVEFNSALVDDNRLDGACKAVAKAISQVYTRRKNPKVRRITDSQTKWWEMLDWEDNSLDGAQNQFMAFIPMDIDKKYINSYPRVRISKDKTKTRPYAIEIFGPGGIWKWSSIQYAKILDTFEYDPADNYNMLMDKEADRKKWIASLQDELEKWYANIGGDDALLELNFAEIYAWAAEHDSKKQATITNPKEKPATVVVKKSTNPEKKLMAVFEYPSGKKVTTHFGQRGASDYTQHKNEDRMKLYLGRHGGGKIRSKKEKWHEPETAGALSRWILWNKPDLEASFKDFCKRFNLKGELKAEKTNFKRNPKVHRKAKPTGDWWNNYDWEIVREPEVIEYEAKYLGGERRIIFAIAKDNEADIKISILVRMPVNQFGERVFVEFWPMYDEVAGREPNANDVNDKQRAWLKDKDAYIFDYGAGKWALKDSGLSDPHPDIIDIGNYIRRLEGYGHSDFAKTRNNPKVRRRLDVADEVDNSWTDGTPWRTIYGHKWHAVDTLHAKTGLFLRTTYPKDHRYLGWNDEAWNTSGNAYRRARQRSRGERVLTHWNGLPLIHRYPRFLKEVKVMEEWEIDSPDFDLSLPAPWWAKTGTKISDFEREKSFTQWHEWIIPFEWNGRLFDFKMENNDFINQYEFDEENAYWWHIVIELMNGEKMTGKQWNRMFKDLNLDFIKWNGHVLYRPGNYTGTEKVSGNNRRKFDKVFTPKWVDDKGKSRRDATWRRNPIHHHDEMLNDDADLAPLQDVMLSKNAEIEIEDGRWYPNYGHFLGFINIADDMGWDIYAPGFENQVRPGVYRVKSILGVLKLKNGNDKICVELDLPEYNDELVISQILDFKEYYQNDTGMEMVFER